MSGESKQLFFSSRDCGRLVLRILPFLVFMAIFIWAYWRLAALGMSYEWQWNRVWRYFCQWTSQGFKAGPLLKGLLMTIGIALLGTLLSTILGLLAAFMRLCAWPACQYISLIYISLLRNTPLLLQLFFVYFLISPIFGLDPFWSAVLALSTFEGAYMAELFRSALLSVPATQWEAGLSLGFNLRQCLFHIALPQAFHNALPAFTNQAVTIIKDTSLVSAIAVADLTMQAQAIVAETFLAFEVWLFVGALYLAITLCVALPGLWLERKDKYAR